MATLHLVSGKTLNRWRDAIRRAGLNPGAGLVANVSDTRTLARAGWLVREGEVFGIRTPSHGLRLSLGRLSDAEISRLAADIAQALDAP